MKDEMDEISVIILRLYENVNDGNQWDKTIQELQRLLCYREVRAYYRAVLSHDGTFTWFGLRGEILEELNGEYSSGMLLEAIQKVKNEQK